MQCTELPNITHVEVINAFLEGTTCRNLVHELARSRPANTNELFDAATTSPARRQLVPFLTTSRTSARKMRPQRAATPRSMPPPRNKSGGREGRSRPHRTSVDRGRRKTPTRPSSLPQTAKDLETPLEVVAAYSTTC